MPDTKPISDGAGTPERVAFDLLLKLVGVDVMSKPVAERKAALLDLYAECLHATRGYRDYPGKP